ncbi:MAG TPA: SlyX family protein [Beijerinckiaceae bacterium]|jgi:SlyX protein
MTAEDAHAEPTRLEAIEMRVAHQEFALAELNEALTAQWRRIEQLERLVAQLRDELQNVGAGREGPEPPPPHY